MTCHTVQQSAIPNIRGDAPIGQDFVLEDYNKVFSGAFYIKNLTEKTWGPGKNDKINRPIGFDASRCSKVYSNVKEARPTNVAVRFIIKY